MSDFGDAFCYYAPNVCSIGPDRMSAPKKGQARCQARKGGSGRGVHWFPSAAGLSTRLAYARLKAAGVAPEPLLRKVSLTQQQIDRADPVRVHHQIEFLGLASEALDDDLLGVHLAQAVDLREIGALYYVLASSSTLVEALQRGVRYSSIGNEGISLKLLSDDAFGVSFHYVGVSRHIDRHQIEFWMTALVRICRQVTGLNILPNRVRLTHHRARNVRLAGALGAHIEFSTAVDDISFPKHVKHAPLVSADLHLNKILRSYCEEALAQKSRTRDSIRLRVENAIVPLLPHGEAQVGEVAHRIGVSQRTLARRLAEEETSFSALLENLRSDLANRYLAEPDMTVSQISWLLGYKDVAAFSHAFKRWTGKTPGSVRSAYVH